MLNTPRPKRSAPHYSKHETHRMTPKRPKLMADNQSLQPSHMSTSASHWRMQDAPRHSIASNIRAGYIDVHEHGDTSDARELLNSMKKKRSGSEQESTQVPPPKRHHNAQYSTSRHNHTDSALHSDTHTNMHWLEKFRSSSRSLDKRAFAGILNNLRPIYEESKHIVFLLVQILSNPTRKRSRGYFTPLFRPEPNFFFFQCISSYICSVPQEGDPQKRMAFLQTLGDIIALFEELLETHPFDAPEFLPIDACCGTVEQLCRQDFMFKEIEERVTQLKVLRDKKRQDLYETVHNTETIVEEDILPSPEELHSRTFSVPLKVNTISGPFPSVSEYISTFYGLIRADFIYPLQETLDKVKTKKEYLYENVQVESSFQDYVNDEIICKLKFTIQRKIKWEYSKRLKYGNLLCLSEDNFSTVIFATVSERELEDLRNGLLTIKLIGRASKDPCCTSSEKKYTMFESPTYYEAYAPIARALLMLAQEPEKLPFQNFLVRCGSSVEMPAYLKQKGIKLNLHNVICSCSDEELPCTHTSIDIEDIKQEKVKTSSSVTFDQSQLKALCTALTKELALIQGPPGTGKTYIGLKIVKSLLINKSIWAPLDNVPIMVVCYTNHALDQFLEGLAVIKDKRNKSYINIRRVGGRSKSTVLKQFHIKNFVTQKMRADGVQFIPKSKLSTLQKKLEALKQFLDGSTDTVKMYSFFLSEAIIDEIRWSCMIFIDLPDFSNWELIKSRESIEEIHELYDQFDDDDYRTDYVYEENSLKQFVSFFHDKIFSLDDKRAKELLQKNLWAEDVRLHLRLFKYCLEKLVDAWQAETEYNAEKYAEYSRRLELTRIKCLKEADVIGLTITGAAKWHKALTQVKSKICVIEEAAEVLEPHVFTTLTSHVQHLILIGDHKQLRPKTNSHEIGYKYKLEVSLFERLVRNNFPLVTLETQHRMRPEISSLISKNIYDGQIRDSESVKKYENVRGMFYNMYFIDHQELEARDEDSSSPYNVHEAEFVVLIWKYLLQNGFKSDEITIITPYIGQMRKLRQINSQMHVTTLDNFQGEENEIILLSMVRSNTENVVGFTKIDNRVCVAMSRAKIGFYCIGNFSTYRKSSNLWRSILSDLEQRDPKRLSAKLPLKCRTHKTRTEISCAQDFKKISSGGCGKPCRIRLPICNHACNRECHPVNLSHDGISCTEPCSKRCSEDLHRCKNFCGYKCPPCKVLVKKIIPNCRHEQQVPCCIQPTKFSCQVDCQKILSCGHHCKLKCGEDCNKMPCKFLVTREWPCGHKAQKECHVTELDYSLKCSFPCNAILECEHKCSGKCGECRQGRFHKRCEEKCTRILVCNHPCTEPCAKNCPPCKEDCIFECPHALCGKKCWEECKPCPHYCEWKCEHYECTRNCGEPCDRQRCNEPCRKKLKCGHNCIGLCGEPCPKECRVCNKDSGTFSIMFGEEDNPDSHFVQLADCNHVIEANALDKWVDNESISDGVVDWKRCPLCKSPIITTLRYSNEAKQVLKDINAIKKKSILTKREKSYYSEEAQTETLCRTALDNLSKCTIDRSLRDPLRRRLERFKTTQDSAQSSILFKDSLMIIQIVSQLLATIEALQGKNFVEKYINALNSQTVNTLHWLLSKLSGSITFTNQMRTDITNECRRITLLRKVYLFQYNIRNLSASDLSTIKQLQTKYECLGFKPDVVTEDAFQRSLKEMQVMADRYQVPLTLGERQMIITAMGAKKGSWYKCKNGHFYQIGQCGGAMETSKCPECSAVIGGGQHRLAEGNEHAREFDNSSYAAWSEGANLANYEGIH